MLSLVIAHTHTLAHKNTPPHTLNTYTAGSGHAGSALAIGIHT
jgi:hypothetical protein